jgi:DNA (cytosine-5)-methyltransferase 1
MRPTHVSIFSGCGGFTAGLKAAGFRTSLALDLDPVCLASHRLNHPEAAALQADLGRADPRDLAGMLVRERLVGRPVSLVTMGPPCEPFSGASPRTRGEREGDPRRGLFRPAIELAAALAADFVVVENTARVEAYPEAGWILETLARAGYRNRLASVLDAAEHGVPQRRRRWFVLAARDSSVRLRWPEPVTPGRPVTVREAFAGLPAEPGDGHGEGTSGFAVLMRDHGFWGLAALPGLTHHEAPAQTPAMQLRRRLVRPGRRAKDLRRSMPAGMAEALAGCGVLPRRDFGQRDYRLRWDRPANTVTAHVAEELIAPQGGRPVTAREAARLQSFPDAYRWAGRLTGPGNAGLQSVYAQIGDSVPPLLACRLGVTIKEIAG